MERIEHGGKVDPSFVPVIALVFFAGLLGIAGLGSTLYDKRKATIEATKPMICGPLNITDIVRQIENGTLKPADTLPKNVRFAVQSDTFSLYITTRGAYYGEDRSHNCRFYVDKKCWDMCLSEQAISKLTEGQTKLLKARVQESLEKAEMGKLDRIIKELDGK